MTNAHTECPHCQDSDMAHWTEDPCYAVHGTDLSVAWEIYNQVFAEYVIDGDPKRSDNGLLE